MNNNNNYPAIPINDIYDIMESDAIDNARKKKDFSTYEFNGIPVPRVTKIIDSCMNREFLIPWALGLGKYGYYNEKDFATAVGTKVHEAIEHFLTTGEDMVIDEKKAPKQYPVIMRAYNNFKNWYNNLIKNGNIFELIGLEVKLVTPIYAGTLDCICKINGAIYILDFKTSKNISDEYIMQVCAYKWAVDNGYLYDSLGVNHIDGIGIIRVDKFEYRADDLFLNEFNPIQNKIINDHIIGFMSILNTYYNKLNMEYEFNNYKKSYEGINKIINNCITMEDK